MDIYSKFFILGLQKSGTKYLKRLVDTNTNLKFVSDYVWKHTMDMSQIKDDDVVKFWITKSPYNWIRSVLYRHRVDILTKYKRYDLKSKDGLVVRGLNVGNLMNLYNDYHRTLIDRFEPVQYEQLLLECFDFFKDLHHKGFEVILPPIKDISNSKFFIEEETRREYLSVPRHNDPLVVEINKYIDKDLMIKLGYRIA